MIPDETENDIRLREMMVRQQLRGRGISDERVLRIMAQLPRQHFIPSAHRAEAYYDQPVSIGLGQTISQPYIVALMTEKLQIEANHRILEIGTGCGYQTAILAQLARRIYTVERIEALLYQARQNLHGLGLKNVEYLLGDGSLGWIIPITPSWNIKDSKKDEEPNGNMAPGKKTTPDFDRILVAAAAESTPARLLDQLAVNGKMVLPVGPLHHQKLILLEKIPDKKQQIKIKETLLCYCRFVKLVCED